MSEKDLRKILERMIPFVEDYLSYAEDRWGSDFSDAKDIADVLQEAKEALCSE